MKKVDDTTPAPCGHRGCRLKPSEVRAQLLASTALDDPDLTRVCDQDEAVAGGAIPDFRSRRHVVEVKELTSQALRRFIDLYEALPQRYIPKYSFRYLWAVSVDVSRAAGAYGGNPKTPEVKTLIATSTQLIEDLESRGIINSLADHENFPKYAKALGFYSNCAVVPDSPLGPGILLSGTISGQARTLDLDYDVTAFLQDWLDSEQSTNARQSLAGRAGIHVLVLMASLDGPAAGLIHTLRETPGEVPAAALRLPDDIDVLIVTTNIDVLRFTPNGGWLRHTAPPPP
ncbi:MULTISPECIES: hypothetical protein [Mycobacteriaceae]|uniref:Uncharacterized protein n=4 Tax=Mycobacteriaceae TaxID=1762 RepID=A0A0F5MX93_9MYCO|nr:MULTISPECIES: hypothetical protein [Mycobacteriaceae]MBX9921897.1 hypothetical protein [Mycolicibacterium frederiksbergense]OKH80147.1 hypothetical protein EB73_33845 [Mycobacterium sp. SWH-M3]KKB98677.1 hypothetical protein WR43_13435 [Mycolicibacter arupensis]KRQ20752.1 hypothetical protein AOT87_17640 [Mycobacteroides sp. H003]KRQ35170.1 hypothetical protein AOT92_24525 [Mycobacteroides sp. H101]